MFSVISRTDARRNSQCLPPRALGSDTTDATCLSAQPDAAQGAERHAGKVFCDGTANGPLPKAGRGRMTPAAGASNRASRCLNIVAQCSGLSLHFMQAVLDDVTDR